MSSDVAKKLKLEKYKHKLILNLPKEVVDFEEITFDVKTIKPKYDLVFAFIFSLKEFISHVEMVIGKELLNADGYLYIVYPKKGNKKYKEYVRRDDFFEAVSMDEDGYVNGSQLKFAKMVSFSDVFTVVGLKWQLCKATSATKLSQCVDDYIDRIPD